MRTTIFIVLTVFTQINKILSTSAFGTIYPIPLSITNDDPNFKVCPVESGAYPHSTNCSLFHMCTFGIHTIYSCIDEFFFNPVTGKCQHWQIDKESNCTKILKAMGDMDLLLPVESVKDNNYYNRRKSETSECTQTGIYPDILDCSLFHYCHQNTKHEILRCPKGLNFDPKLFMCSAFQLVNCQYEPSTESPVTADEIDHSSIKESDDICHDYVPGTHLPVANKFDEYIICGDGGKYSVKNCQMGYIYNALTAECEIKLCAKKSDLCKNNGQCVDEPMNPKGFTCLCSTEYEGEYCDRHIESNDKKVENLLQLADRLNDKDLDTITITLKTTCATNIMDNIPSTTSSKQKSSTKQGNPTRINLPFSSVFHRFTNNQHEHRQTDEIIKIIFITILIMTFLVFLVSILFGAVLFLRMILHSSTERVGTWKTLTEESKV